MKFSKKPLGLVLASLLIAAPLPAVFAADAKDLYQQARELMQKGEDKAAVIQLKNALQRDPEFAQARLELGRLYLKYNDGASAEKELRRAAKLGVSRDKWLLPLGRAYLLQSKYVELLDKLTPEDGATPAERAEILTLRGKAYLGLKDLNEARSAFNDALALTPGNGDAQLGLIRIQIVNGDKKGALEELSKLIKAHPDNEDARLIRGELLRLAGKPAEAVGDLSFVLEKDPKNLRARFARASAYIALHQYDKAIDDIKVVEEMFPESPMATYLRGLIAYQRKDLAKAEGYIQEVLQGVPNHLQSVLLYGSIKYGLKNYDVANDYLSRVMESGVDHPAVYKMIGASRVKLNRVKDAIEVLLKGVKKYPKDAQLMAMLGAAYMRLGKNAEGSKWLEKAVEVSPNVAAYRTQLALGKLAGGEADDAIAELESAVNLGKGLVQADVLLVLGYLKKQEFDKALEAAQALVDKMPKSPVPYNLKGLAYLSKGDKAAAKKSFEQALKIDSDFHTARINLARVALLEKDYDTAGRYFDEVLKADPKNTQAFLGRIQVARMLGKQEEILPLLQKAVAANPDAFEPKLLLTQYYLDRREYLKAMSYASELERQFPNNPMVAKAVGQTRLAAGEANSAVINLQQYADANPKSVQAWLLLAKAQLKSGDKSGARASFRHLTEIAPHSAEVQTALAGMELDAGNLDTAMSIGKRMQKEHPALSMGYEIEALVHFRKKDKQAGIAALEKAYRIKPSAGLVDNLARQYHDLGRFEESRKILRKWLKAHPDDAAIRITYASLLQTQGKYDEAQKQYERVMKAQPHNPVVLNNLAWLYGRKGDPRAIKVAKRAYEYAPDRPEIQDTYGWLLVKAGKVEQGLRTLQEALTKMPNHPEIGYHVAYALKKLGRKDEANKVVAGILSNYPESPFAAKARKLVE